MKTVFALALLASNTVAMASSVSLEDSKNLPRISNSEIRVSNGPDRATVEPTYSVKFSYESCATMGFSAKTTETADLFLVAIKLDSEIDCRALGIVREYNVQISSTHISKPIVILNPVGLNSSSTLAVPRICTMDAGVMFNPETGECVGFNNGCRRAELAAKGFTFAQADQCNL